jgi:hypothetical protein
MDKTSFALIVAAARREVEKALANADRKAIDAFAPAFVVKDGHLLMHHGGTVADLGNVVGPRGIDGFGIKGDDGKDGRDGIDGKGIDGRDGVDGKDGRDGKDGLNGKDGADGVSITGARVSDKGFLIISLSDGRDITAGYVRGPKGDKGDRGAPGISGGAVMFGGGGSSSGGAAAWGGITGTLSDQTDLQLALDGKQNAGSYATAAQGALADTALQPGDDIPTSDVIGLDTALAGKAPIAAAVPVGGTTGQVLTKTSGADYAAAWETPSGGGGAISYADATLAADVALAANNTWYDGPSVTLSSGTWVIHVGGHYRRGTTGAANVAIRAWDGTTAYAHAEVYHPSVTNVEVNPVAFGIAVLAGSATVTLQMLASSGNAAALMKAATAANGQGNIATRITAVKLA